MRDSYENKGLILFIYIHRPIFAEIAPNKTITDNQKFRKKRSKIYAEALQSVGTSNSDDEVLEPRKAPNVLKEENHDFNRTIGINLESIYARLREDELLGSDTLSSPPRLCRHFFFSKFIWV